MEEIEKRNKKWFDKYGSDKKRELFDKRKEEVENSYDPIVSVEIRVLNKGTSALFNLDTFEWHWTSKARNSSKFEELSEHYRSSYIPKIVRFFNKQKR